jgi:hypothetical protein
MAVLQRDLFLNVMTPEQVTLDLTGRTVAGTGHRPPKLGGYEESVYARLVAFARRWVEALQPKLVISGAALGLDFALADAAIIASVPLHLAIPCDTQSGRWPPASRRKYDWLRSRATSERVVCPGPYRPDVMDRRNHYMVDYAAREQGLIFALWDGSAGGTRNCLAYSERYDLDRINAWDDYARFARAA